MQITTLEAKIPNSMTPALVRALLCVMSRLMFMLEEGTAMARGSPERCWAGVIPALL